MTVVSDERQQTKALADQSEEHHSIHEHTQWYAVYTWPRHEKKVARHFEDRGIAHFLPLYASIQKWNRRTAKISVPLFPGYIFVQTARNHRNLTLGVPGVVHFVGTAKSPTEIPADEIELLRNTLRMGHKVEPHPYLAPGNRVRIASGPMAGLCGTIQRTSAGCRIVVSVDLIMRSVAIEVDAASLMAA